MFDVAPERGYYSVGKSACLAEALPPSTCPFTRPKARRTSQTTVPAGSGRLATSAASRGLQVIIAGAGGAAHLPGMIAAQTTIPVLGVPVKSRAMEGFDSLLSIVQMPAGIPVATFAIGEAGAKNAALFAISQLALLHGPLAARLRKFRAAQTKVAAASRLEHPKKLRRSR
jgi:5-(carboxyamino)imidazole ribonucleotide mutase